MKFKNDVGENIYLNLNDSIASGGEGTIFIHPTNKGEAIKIYHAPKNISYKKKYEDLSNLDSKYFIKPLSLLYNRRNEIAGFTMKYLDTSEYFIFKKLTSRNFCLKNNLDRQFKYKVYQNIKKALVNAAKEKIIIGDLNPYNIFIDKNAGVYFVDVDSYGTKKYPHSGIILDDVRDFILDPNINEETDAYAFDILVFWMFTYVHPYRGMLKGYTSLKERAQNCISILKNRTGLIIPNVYETFNNPIILKQFYDIFEEKKRYIVDLAATHINNIKSANYTIPALESKDVYIQLLSSIALNVKASKNLINIKTSFGHEVYDVKNYGKAIKLFNDQVDDILIGEKNFVILSHNKLFFEKTNLTNIKIDETSKIFSDYYGTFIFQKNNSCLKVNPDAIINNNISYDIINCNYPSIIISDAVIQHVGNKSNLLVLNKNAHRTIPLNRIIKNAYYRNDLILLEYVQGNEIKYSLYSAKEYKIKHILDLEDFVFFDVKDDLIFFPAEDAIKVYSISSKKEILNIECKQCKAYSKIFISNAGIILQTNNNVYLLNRK